MSKENKKETVCAVVVTYNRKNLLLECLEAIRRQTRPVDGIYIIDNASDDGTPELLKENGYIPELPPFSISDPYEIEHKISNLVDGNHINVFYVRMHKNTGGAGRFYEGVKRGYERGYDWLWLMDDDAIPTKTALKNLLNKTTVLSINEIGFLCSKVLWKDGNPHIMNIPSVKPFINGIPFNIYEEKNILLVESASFVSLLVRRDVVKTVGLPIKEFFIWADDVEYTLRITRKRFAGLYTNDSIVVHKTKANYSASQVYDWRFYYNVRNHLWVYKLHYKNRYIFFLLKTILLTPKLPLKFWHVNIKACADSFFTNPKIYFVDK